MLIVFTSRCDRLSREQRDSCQNLEHCHTSDRGEVCDIRAGVVNRQVALQSGVSTQKVYSDYRLCGIDVFNERRQTTAEGVKRRRSMRRSNSDN